MSMLHVAAILLFLLGLAHSILGERYILMPLFRRDNLPRLFGDTTFTTRTMRIAWHITTVLWWGFAVLLWQLASAPATTSLVLATIGWTSMLAGLLPMVITRGLHLSWMVLFAVGGICVYAAAI